jgi:hypothetical protein
MLFLVMIMAYTHTVSAAETDLNIVQVSIAYLEKTLREKQQAAIGMVSGVELCWCLSVACSGDHLLQVVRHLAQLLVPLTEQHLPRPSHH